MIFYNEKKDAYEIDESKLLAKGGEGSIYKINSNIVAKVLHGPNRTESRERKIKAMIASAEGKNTELLAWPKEILYDDNGNFAGYTMPYIDGKTFSDAAAALDHNLDWKHKLELAINLSAAVNNLHLLGHVVGDLNTGNVLYNDQTGDIALIDCDSYHITDPNDKKEYPCVVCKEEYIAPELQYKFGTPDHYFTKESDYFALAIIIFQLLAYDTHPFSVRVINDESLEKYFPLENIRAGRCIYFPETCEYCKDEIEKPLSFTLELNEIYPQNICELFRRTFVEGHKDPKKRASAEEWYHALMNLRGNLITCKRHHYYYDGLEECPLCLNILKKLDITYQSKLESYMIENPPASNQGSKLSGFVKSLREKMFK